MKLLTHVLFSLLLFPVFIFAALHFIFGQSLVQSGLELRMNAICDPNPVPHPYRLPYTSISNVDKVVCGMIVFYHALLDPAYNALLAVVFPAVGVAAFIPFLEAARDHRPFVLRVPTANSAIFQLVSMGIVMPIYSFLFVTTNTASIRPDPTSKINQGNAEALLFGVLLGYVFPTVLMISLVRVSVTAIWQGFPFLMALSIFVHKLIRPPSRLVQSGHTTVMVTLAFTFLVSALLHVIYVWPVFTDIPAFRTMFIPTVNGFDPTVASLADGVLAFIQWDVILALGSIMFATFWMADSLLSFVGILAWYGTASIAFGPAAAVTGVFLWRETRLNGQSPEKVPQKTE